MLTFGGEIDSFTESNPKLYAMKNPIGTGSKILIFITIILSSVLFLFFSIALVPKIIGGIIDEGVSSLYSGGWEGLVMIWTYVVFLIGFIIVWWHKLIGGIIIFLSSILQMAPFLIINGNLGSLIFGIPLLVVGLLFIFIPEFRTKKVTS